jgi:hypothetical protein
MRLFAFEPFFLPDFLVAISKALKLGAWGYEAFS